MKKNIVFVLALVCLGLVCLGLLSGNAIAGEFQWVDSFNIEAEQNMARFSLRLQARFGMSKDKITRIIARAETAADAYLSLRIGEMIHRSADEVLDQYRGGKKKGWGALAKRLGIKPGSKEFHELKARHDLSAGNTDGDAGKDGDGQAKGKHGDHKNGKSSKGKK